jgi:hypothetical protein
MKQRVADALQLSGAAVLVVAGASISATVGLYSAVVALVVAGVVVERS